VNSWHWQSVDRQHYVIAVDYRITNVKMNKSYCIIGEVAVL